MIHAHLRAQTPDTAEVVQSSLHGISKDGEETNPFLPQLATYREFARGYGCDFVSAERPLWTHDIPLEGGVTLRFMGLTSVQVSDLNDEEGKMILGRSQYAFSEEDNVIPVVLIHHPLNWFIDKLEASRLLTAHARLIMFGHEHRLNIQKTVDELAKREQLVIFAGATNPPEIGGDYEFRYNWLELSCRPINGCSYLAVKIFPRVWLPSQVKFVPDRNRLAGVDFIEVPIACTNVVQAELNVVAASPKHTIMMELAPSVPQPIEPTPRESPGQSETPMYEVSMSDDHDSFIRLRYLFWRYLDWRQRLTILVKVNALPHVPDEQLPQTLERLALEAVKSSGKLRELWDAMMPLIPVEKRANNPFPARSE